MENKSYDTCFYLTKNRLSVSLTETKQQNKHNPIISFFFFNWQQTKAVTLQRTSVFEIFAYLHMG